MPVVLHNPRRPELEGILGVTEIRRGTVGKRRPRVRHDVIGSQDLRVRPVVLHHVRNQLQGRPARTMLHPAHPVIEWSEIAAGMGRLLAAVGLVGELDQMCSVVVQNVAVVPVRQQPVVAAANQELVKLGDPPSIPGSWYAGPTHPRLPPPHAPPPSECGPQRSTPPAAGSCDSRPAPPCRTTSPPSAPPATTHPRPKDPGSAACSQSPQTLTPPARRRRATRPEPCSGCSCRRPHLRRSPRRFSKAPQVERLVVHLRRRRAAQEHQPSMA